ncbi:MAG: NADPH-dependent F420 reductase [Anaerolineae bacterium]|nr:NADPH-dependent F420 reductase [Anaerolineae bacterium]
MTETCKRTIAIIGGTGKEGKGLAYRWGKAGHRILIGSRDAVKAMQTVSELRGKPGLHDADLEGYENFAAAESAEIVVLTVPYAVHVDTLDYLRPALQGKILIDVTVPLVPPKVSMVQMPREGSAAMQAQGLLGDGVTVVAAFQNVSFEHLMTDVVPECDILVCGRTREARECVLSLISDAGLVGWDAGYLENSVVVEGLTSVLIGLNRKYGVKSAGIQITGIPRE